MVSQPGGTAPRRRQALVLHKRKGRHGAWRPSSKIRCERVFTPGLRSRYVLGLQSFGTFLHLKFHFAAFVQGPVSGHLDGRKVNEHVLTVGPLDESIAFCGIKPFHDTFFSHCLFLLVGRYTARTQTQVWYCDCNSTHLARVPRVLLCNLLASHHCRMYFRSTQQIIHGVRRLFLGE